MGHGRVWLYGIVVALATTGCIDDLELPDLGPLDPAADADVAADGIAPDATVDPDLSANPDVADLAVDPDMAPDLAVDPDMAPVEPDMEPDEGADPDVGPACDDAELDQPCTSDGVGVCAREGQTVCRDGVVVCDAVPGEPTEEVCGDELDNDCDGEADESPGTPCEAGVGACTRQGIIVCSGDALACDAVPGEPTDEVCGDELDNDCDGEADEPPGDPCEAGVGACAADGILVCVGGEAVCDAEVGMPAEEVCDGADNDCDGAVDEQAAEACTVGEGACARDGANACVGGERAGCDAVPGEPAVEWCNGRDDDCDGQTDEDLDCTQCGGELASPCNGADGVAVPAGWVYIPAGVRQIGAEPDEGRPRDRPVQTIELARPVLMSVTETTRADWQAVGQWAVESGVWDGAAPILAPSHHFDEDQCAAPVDGNDPPGFCCSEACPVESVSWFDAVWHANMRSLREGLQPCYDLSTCVGAPGCTDAGCGGVLVCDGAVDGPLAEVILGCDGYRLPTEAEWETAVRADADPRTPYWSGNDLNGASHAVGNDSPRVVGPVPGEPEHPWGLADMHGNVWEWVGDLHGPYPDVPPARPPIDRVALPLATGARVYRGGGYASGRGDNRSPIRNYSQPNDRTLSLGFRLVRVIEPDVSSGPRVVAVDAEPADGIVLDGQPVTVTVRVEGGPVTGALYATRTSDDGSGWLADLEPTDDPAVLVAQIDRAALERVEVLATARRNDDVIRVVAHVIDDAGRTAIDDVSVQMPCEVDGEPVGRCGGRCMSAPDAVCCGLLDGGERAAPPCNGAPPDVEVPAGWVYLPPGEFMMGAPVCEPGAIEGREQPRHAVGVTRGVLMKATEVSRAEWRALAEARGEAGTWPAHWAPVGPDGPVDQRCDGCPVETVSWFDAVWYANALSAEAGLIPCYDAAVLDTCTGGVGTGCIDTSECSCRPEEGCDRAGDLFECDIAATVRLADPVPGCTGYRLPTDAEWSHGARAGTASVPGPPGSGLEELGCVCGLDEDRSRCPAAWWGDDPPADPSGIENCDPENAPGRPRAAAGPEAGNGFGLRDMMGNVSEWVQDHKRAGIGLVPADPDDVLVRSIDPVGPVFDPSHLWRGSNHENPCRVAYRTSASSRSRYRRTGFRLVREVGARPGVDVVELREGVVDGQRGLIATVSGNGEVSGRLSLAGERGGVNDLGPFEQDPASPETWRAPIDFAAIAAHQPVEGDGVGPFILVASFTDGSGARSSRAVVLPANCDGVDDDGDGRSDHPNCAEVVCGPEREGDPVPPCNGAPDGTVIPNGWVYVPAGEFTMGSDAAEDVDTIRGPAFPVRVSRPFLMMQTEVTRADWRRVVGSWNVVNEPDARLEPSGRVDGDHPDCAGEDDGACPVRRINWWEAIWYANVASEQAGLTACYDPVTLTACTGLPASAPVLGSGDVNVAGDRWWCEDRNNWPRRLLWPEHLGEGLPLQACDGIRLPTEAEWVRAATLGGSFDGAATPRSQPTQSGEFDTLGLYDMNGNMLEWTDDDYGPFAVLDPDGSPVLVDPGGPIYEPRRVLRGEVDDRFYRVGQDPGDRRDSIGLRLVRTVPDAADPASTYPDVRIDQVEESSIARNRPASVEFSVVGPPSGGAAVLYRGDDTWPFGPLAPIGDGRQISVLDPVPIPAIEGLGGSEVYGVLRVIDPDGHSAATRVEFPICDGIICDGECVDAEVCPE